MNTNTRYLFIINPISAVRKKRRIISAIKKYCKNMNYVLFYAKDKTAVEEKIKTAVRENTPYIIAVGGDGTVNLVSQYLINTNSTLGIIPAGSGNGLAHFLKIPFNPKKNLRAMLDGKTCLIDSCRINNKHFISIAGIGFDAHIAHLFNQSKRRGFFTYLKLVIQAYFQYKEQEYTIIADGKSYNRKAFLISFANSNQFGYKTVISPIANIKDGVVDICILKRPSVLAVLFIWPLLFLKKMHKTKYLEIIQAKEIFLLNCENELIQFDGEYTKNTSSDKIHIKVFQQNLKIVKYT